MFPADIARRKAQRAEWLLAVGMANEPVGSELHRRLSAERDMLLRDFDSMHTTLTPEAALEALEAVDQDDP